MKSFKQFKLMVEALTPYQKRKVNTWERGDNSFSDKAFNSPSEERTSLELEHPPEPSDHRTKIINHLSNHGISVSDYTSGTATDKHGRTIKIGKALEKTKAGDELKNGFANDPARQQKKVSSAQDQYHVSISRHPHDVAGMTSKGHSWEDESCMNFSSGERRDCLPEDLKHGTHVAYLTDKDDKENERPLARIAIKKFTNIDDDQDNVLRPEHRVYGAAGDAFSHTVNKWCEKHFPMKKDGIYKKHDDVYDDSREPYHFGGEEAISKGLEHHDVDVRRAAARHHLANAEQIHKALDDDDYRVRREAAGNENANDDHLHKALGDDDWMVREEAASHKNANAEHLTKALGDDNYYVRAAAARNLNANKEHLDRALGDKHAAVRMTAAWNQKANADHLHKALSDDDVDVRKAAAGNVKVNADHLHKALSDDDYGVRMVAASHKNANDEHLDRALGDDDWNVREAAAKNQNANKDHLEKALGDDDWNVRKAAAKNQNANKEHLEKALNDKHSLIREIAQKRLDSGDYKKD